MNTKAVTKESGEIVEVTRIETRRVEGKLIGAHEIFCPIDLELSCIDADWEQRRYELAKAAMQGFCSNPHEQIMSADSNVVAEWSIGFADAMIKKLKGGKE